MPYCPEGSQQSTFTIYSSNAGNIWRKDTGKGTSVSQWTVAIVKVIFWYALLLEIHEGFQKRLKKGLVGMCAKAEAKLPLEAVLLLPNLQTSS